MIKQKLLLLVLSAILAVPVLACGTVGVYDPQATQVAMEGTVTALQATITALESKINDSQTGASTQLVVTNVPNPTATATAGSAANSTVIAASSLGQSLELTSTPTPFAIQPEDKTVVLVATFTPTPTPERYDDAPVLLEPRAGTIVEEGREVLLGWSWNGLLGPNEHFDIKLRPDGQTRSAYVAWERGEAHDLTANLAPGRYYWSVQVIKGYYKNDSGEPEDRVFEAFLSPESKPRLIIVAEDRDDPTPTPTERPDLSPDGQTPESTPEATETPDEDTEGEDGSADQEDASDGTAAE